MKLQFLGTAAAEGIPAIFCSCRNCQKSRRMGGRAIRTRSQALIDDQLLIDFPADTYMHILGNQITTTQIQHCVITHSHSDHLYEKDIAMLKKGFAYVPEQYHLNFYGSQPVGAQVEPVIDAHLAQDNRGSFHTIQAFDCFEAGKYSITALPAIHDAKSGPLSYQISDGEKTMLYGNDTHYFHDSVWDYWAKEKPYFHLVSLDGTNACLPLHYIGHMGLSENKAVRERMLAEGYTDEHTIFVCNHFSHNGTCVVYDEFVPIALKEGFLTSYDGMIVEF